MGLAPTRVRSKVLESNSTFGFPDDIAQSNERQLIRLRCSIDLDSGAREGKREWSLRCRMRSRVLGQIFTTKTCGVTCQV